MTVLVYEQTGWRPMITARSSRTSLVGGKRPRGVAFEYEVIEPPV
jgi:hypothetical protein